MSKFKGQKDLQLIVKIRDKEERLVSLLSPFESYILLLERILVWELPLASSALIVAVHILFWLATTVRLYFLFGVTCIVLVLLDLAVVHLLSNTEVNDSDESSSWTELHPRLLGVPELSHHIAEFWVVGLDWLDSAIELRTNNRPKFFVLSIIYLSIFAVVGVYVRGIWILYAAVIGVLTWPCIKYHCICDKVHAAIEPTIRRFEQKLNIKRTRSSTQGRKKKNVEAGTGEQSTGSAVEMLPGTEADGDSDDGLLDEFLPSMNTNVLSTLNQALSADVTVDDDDDEFNAEHMESLTPDLSQHSDDELFGEDATSLMHGLGTEMPSINDVDGNRLGLRDDDSDDNWGLSDRIGDASVDPSDDLVDDSLSADDNLALSDTRPERDSDEDDDDNFTAGLNFNDDVDDVDEHRSETPAAPSMLGNLLGGSTSTLMAALTSSGAVSGLMSTAASGLTALRQAVARRGSLTGSSQPPALQAAAAAAAPATDTDTMLEAEFEFLNQAELDDDEDRL